MNEASHALIRRFEEQLLQPEFRAQAAAVAALLAEDFIEIGAGGRCYTRSEIVTALAQESGFCGRLSGFEARDLGPGWVLATYRARAQRSGQAPVESLRSSIWCLREGRWQLRFHQGTRAAV